jgi:hypothetical protein
MNRDEALRDTGELEHRIDALLLSRMENRILTDSEKSELLVRSAAAIFVWPGLGETKEELMADPTVGMIIGTTESADKMFRYQEGQLLYKNIEILMPERFRPYHKMHLVSFILLPDPRQMGSRLGAGRGIFGLTQMAEEFPMELGLQQRMGKGGRQKCLVALPAIARENAPTTNHP